MIKGCKDWCIFRTLGVLMRTFWAIVPCLAGTLFVGVSLRAQVNTHQLELDRNRETIVLEPYAQNILRVTLSLQRESAVAAPGYGFVATPSATGWSANQTSKADIYRSDRIVATVDRPDAFGNPPPATLADIAKYFSGSTPGAHITLRTPAGKTLLELTGWSQAVPNQKDGTAELARDRRPSDRCRSYVHLARR
jgi:alpha-D-xyloside xylohydrolase